jgi:hypothetical protein
MKRAMRGRSASRRSYCPIAPRRAPCQFVLLHGGGLPFDDAGEVEEEEDAACAVAMEDGLVDGADLDAAAEFLNALADEGVAGILAGFGLAARELPSSGEGALVGTAREENLPRRARDDGGGNDERLRMIHREGARPPQISMTSGRITGKRWVLSLRKPRRALRTVACTTVLSSCPSRSMAW